MRYIEALPISQLYPLRKSLLSHYAPHLIDICKGVEVLIVVVIKRSLMGHLIYSIVHPDHSKHPGKPQFESVHPLKRDAEELLKACGIDPGAVCRPE